MEAKLTELSEIDSKTNIEAVTEESDVDEAISIFLNKEQKTQSYKEAMDIDIDKINTF